VSQFSLLHIFQSSVVSPTPHQHNPHHLHHQPDTPTEPPPPPAPLQLEELLASSEPAYISPERVRHNKMLMAAAAASITPPPAPGALANGQRTDSPDADSAFCENTSSNSSSGSSGRQPGQLHNQVAPSQEVQ